MKTITRIVIVIALLGLSTGNEINAQNIAITDDPAYVADTSAMLDVKSNTKGILIPRLSTEERLAINDPADGLMVYDTAFKNFFYYNGDQWTSLTMGSTGVAGQALFAVTNLDGDTVFAVYEDGVQVIVPLDSKGKVGGFAVSGRTAGKAGTDETYLRITPDSSRIYFNQDTTTKGSVGGFAVSGRTPGKTTVDDIFVATTDSTRIYVQQDASKGKVGGFAVSGRTPGKSLSEDILIVTADSTRLYVNNDTTSKGSVGGFAVSGRTPGKATVDDMFVTTLDSTRVYVNEAAKGSVGGFAVSGRTPGKTPATSFLNLSSKNYFIGHRSGLNNTTGLYNSFLGYETGLNNREGSENIFIGYQSGFANRGNPEGMGSHNIFIGYKAGVSNDMGFNNIFLGYQAGYSNYGGELEMGSFNTFIGYQSGYYNEIGGSNTFLGYEAGRDNYDGNHNTYLGRWAGAESTEGSYNVFIGTEAGRKEPGSYKLCINAVNDFNYRVPLIYGEFDDRMVVIDGDSTSNPNNFTLFVNGFAGGWEDWNNPSDERLKENIQTIDNALDKVRHLRGVYYNWIDRENHGDRRRMGLIAQESIETIPEVVTGGEEQYNMQYGPISALLIEAIKEQDERIKQLETQLAKYKEANNLLLKEKTELEALIESNNKIQKELDDIKRYLNMKADK